MRIKWKHLLTQLTILVVVELVLSSQGLDNLADYAEFILSRNTIAFSNR